MDLRSKDAIESSKQHDIEMSNILIAEFMGSKHPEFEDMYRLPHGDEYASNLKYDYDWDWLMPVLQKCRQENQLEYFDKVYYALEECDISVTYKAVVEFITNQNN